MDRYRRRDCMESHHAASISPALRPVLDDPLLRRGHVNTQLLTFPVPPDAGLPAAMAPMPAFHALSPDPTQCSANVQNASSSRATATVSSIVALPLSIRRGNS